MRLSPFLALSTFLVAIFSPANAATTDEDCLTACSTYSVVLGWCRGVYGAQPADTNETWANEFVACCCIGEHAGGPLGNASFSSAAGQCQSCEATPAKIRTDLSELITLCAVQVYNGTAWNATSFYPSGYETIEDQQDDPGATSASRQSGHSMSPALGLGLAASVALAVTVM